jgi:hypothetical protein
MNRIVQGCSVVSIGIVVLAGCATGGREGVLLEQPNVYLECATVTGDSINSRRIGPAGGSLRAGSYDMLFLPGAVDSARNITLRQVAGSRFTGNLTIAPPIDSFSRPVAIVIDASRCTAAQLNARPWAIWRVQTPNGPGERLTTGRDGTVFWAETTRHSFVIIADRN